MSEAGVVVTLAPDGSRWLRHGECNQCGQCCLDGGDPSIRNPVFTDADRASGTVAGHCPLLRLHDDGRYGCAGHGVHPYHQSGCDTFPTRPEDIADYPGCSYRFEAVT